MSIIKTDALTKNYGSARGIKDLTLAVEESDFFGFIGPNGAGKSTTIRTLLRLIHKSSGYAEVLGQNLDKPGNAYLSGIGYMASEATFYPSMRVSDIISLSANLRKTDCVKEAKDLCERFDLDTKKKIDELSLGNRKKVAIVCAMQHRPPLYIFDEPTSGLDPLMQKEFYDLLRERNRDGATIFLSSHILSEIQHNCNRAAIIKDGTVVADGAVRDLSYTNARRVNLHGISQIPEGIESKSVISSENSVSFLYTGDIKALMSSLIPLPITAMTISEPDLEEIFLHYYQKGRE